MPRDLSALQMAVNVLAKRCEVAGGKAKVNGFYVKCSLGDLSVEYDADQSLLVVSSPKGYMQMFLDPRDVSNLNFAKLTE